VKFEAAEPLEETALPSLLCSMLYVFSPHMFPERLIMLAPCMRAQDGDRYVSCRPRPTPHGRIAVRITYHTPRLEARAILAPTLVILLSS
jgi:hypothetical protein